MSFFSVDEETGIPTGPLMALKAIAAIMGIDGSIMNQSLVEMNAMMAQFRHSMIDMDQRMKRIETKLDEVLNGAGYTPDGEFIRLFHSDEGEPSRSDNMAGDGSGHRPSGSDGGRSETGISGEPG